MLNTDNLVGTSAALAEVLRFIRKAARTNATVLIQGESGTGKELVARALHINSSRCERPFIAVNCAALPESIVESELFGHEKGAFTGAWTRKKGKFELASGGTLFLDEIGELSLCVQAKLLRALQEREIDPIGGTIPIRVDIRLIAATNRNLRRAVTEGKFREDLFYRLNVISVRTPALRERREDIPVLARHFIATFGDEIERAVRGISPAAEAILCQYDWPGNVRELQNVIQHAMVLGSSDVIELEDLPTAVLAPKRDAEARTLEEAVLKAKREFVEDIFERADGDAKVATAMLRMHPKSMYRFLGKLNLSHLMKIRKDTFAGTAR